MADDLKLKDNFDTDELGSVTKYLSQKLSVALPCTSPTGRYCGKADRKFSHRVISCGDYNDVPASYTYTRVLGNQRCLQRDRQRLGMDICSFLYRFRIDYIMYDKAFQSANYKQGKLRASDHYPIQTGFVFKQ